MKDPKEEARELVDKFWVYALPNANGSWNNAKQCALIAVEELLEILVHELGHDETARGFITYYKNVKFEIEKL